MKRIGRALEVALYAIGGAMILAMMVYVVANALSRTLFRHPFPASLEIVQYLMMPALGCLGFIAATLAHRHVVAEIIFDRFPAIGRKWLVVGNTLLSATILLVLVWFTWDQAIFAFERGFKAGYTEIVSWPLYFCVPASLLISAVLFVHDAWLQSRIAANKEPAGAVRVRDEGLTEQQQDLVDQARAAGEVI